MQEVSTSTFLSNFPSYCLQTFDDKAKDKALASCFAPYEGCGGSLSELNKRGAGIFFTPNAFPYGIRKKQECVDVNAWFFEIDDKSFEEQWDMIEKAPIKPSIVVQTKKSLHCYYPSKDGTITNFEAIQRGLIAHFGADKACKDITRVLRVPGFYHNKQEPYMVKIVRYEPVKVKEADMLEAFPAPMGKVKEVKVQSVEKDDFWDVVSHFNNKMMLERLSGKPIVDGETFSFRPRSSGGEYIDVNGQMADAWIDEQGMIGSSKEGGPTYIQWLEYYGRAKSEIAAWVKENCKDLLPEKLNEEKKDDKETNAGRLLRLFQEQQPLLFVDQMDDPHVAVEINNKKVVLRCETKVFERYLAKLYWDEGAGFIGNDCLSKVSKLVSAQAQYDGGKYDLHNRVALYEDDFYYDLGGGKGVKCARGSWCLVEDLPVLFKSQQHQKEQAVPASSGGEMIRFFDHVAVKDPDQKLLLSVWLVAAFVPGIPHPVLVLFGEKGASKSTTLRFARSVIDPSRIELLSLPYKGELIQQFSHHYAPCYDNITRLSDEVSDVICRAVTGEGGSKRKLYSDDDDFLYSFRRIVALNGVNNVVEKSDLLDRCILIELNRISKKDRKTESAVKEAFESDKPSILAGIFDVLAKARVVFDQLVIDEFPRMADFAHWGCAIAEALGFGKDEFLRAYNSNIGKQNQEVIENDPVANMISVFMEDKDEWEGSPTELFNVLEEVADDVKIDKKFRPKTPAALGKQIKMVQSNLEESGICFESLKDCRGRKGRFYCLIKTAVASDESVEMASVKGSEKDGVDGKDSNSTIEDFNASKCTLGNLSPDDQVSAVEKIMLNS
jgi:hypothetical protein